MGRDPAGTALPLRCRCGAVRGLAREASPSSGLRVVCYCDDCQAWARWLGRDDVLDAHGGTELFQMAPSRLEITRGAERLRCVRLAPKGMLRWHASCCRTPVGNTTASARAPFVGLPRAFMDEESLGRPLQDVLGPPRGHVMGRFAIGGRPAHVHPGVPLVLMLRTVAFLSGGVLGRRHTPSPFFHGDSGRPVIEPEVLQAEERRALAR